MKVRLLLTALAITCGGLLAGSTQAHHPVAYDRAALAAEADRLRYQVEEADGILVAHFARSRMFGEMMSATAQIKGRAVELRQHARHGRDLGRLQDEVARIDALAYRLVLAIDEARFRISQGLDRGHLVASHDVDHQVMSIYGSMVRLRQMVGMSRVYQQRHYVALPATSHWWYTDRAFETGRHFDYGTWSGHGMRQHQRDRSGSGFHRHFTTEHRATSHHVQADHRHLNREGISIQSGGMVLRIGF